MTATERIAWHTKQATSRGFSTTRVRQIQVRAIVRRATPATPIGGIE